MRGIAAAAVFGSMVALTTASATQILVNRGFESGDLTGWVQEHGSGTVVTNSNEMNPDAAYAGIYFHSSSNADEADRQGGDEITVAQTIDVSEFTFIGLGDGRLSAGGFFSGALGGGSGASSDDTGQIIVECFRNGVGGTLLLTLATTPRDPEVGHWNYVSIPATHVPVQTDTIVFRVRTVLDPGFASIDVGADSFTLFLTPAPEPVHLVNPRWEPAGSFSFDFTNAPSASFRALATEDLTTDVETWADIGPATEVSPGQYQVSDAHATDQAARYYAVESE